MCVSVCACLACVCVRPRTHASCMWFHVCVRVCVRAHPPTNVSFVGGRNTDEAEQMYNQFSDLCTPEAHRHWQNFLRVLDIVTLRRTLRRQ